MNIEIGSKLIIKDPTQEVLDYCKSKLTVPNPDFYKKQKLGKWTGSTPQNIHLYERNGGEVWLPFGCIRDLWALYPVKEAYSMAIKPVQRRLYKSSINLYQYQQEAVNKALRAKNGLIVMPCGGGKGLPLDAKIYTPEGWKRNGDLKIGDEVVGSDGETYHVTGIYDKGTVPAYKITFSDGVEIVCDKDHLWNVQKQTQRHDGGKWWTECTEDIYTHYQNIKRQDLYYIPVVHPVKFKHRKTTIDPWLLGFLLGDGCLSTKMVSFSTNENEILQKVKNITCDSVHYKGKYDYYFAGGEIKKKIEKLSLYGHRSWEKFIPSEYKYNSVRVRLKVLQGLFDADGYVGGKGVYEYSTASIQLANDFVEIVESLGGTAKISEKIPTYTYNGEKKVGRKSYRIYFKLYDFKPYMSIKHAERDTKRSQYKKAYRIIKKIEPCGEIISRCITVDAPDSLYVTDHFVVTHNTQTGLELITRIGGRALWLTHTQDLLNQSKDRAKGTLDLCGGKYGTITAGKVNIGTHITFATVQTMCKLDLTQYRDCFDVVIVDECFPGNTKITTLYGQRELKSLNKGDIIATWNGNKVEYKPITHVFKLRPHDMVMVNLSNGTKIPCTSNHPFYTKDGIYKNAGDLKNGDYVLQFLRETDRSGEIVQNVAVSKQKTRVGLLFDGVFEKRREAERTMDTGAKKNRIRNNEENQRKISRTNFTADESEKSNEERGSERKSFKTPKSNRASSTHKMWKRHRADSTATKNDACFSKLYRCICRISNTNKNGPFKWVSNLLQSRHCNSGEYGCNRSRRELALCDRKTKTRSEKNGSFEYVRVDSVEIQKQTSDGTFGGLCSDGYVYNIEVKDNHNYFAENILVHNCQHCCGSPTKVTQFYKAVSNLSARYKIGLTATPKRSDGLEIGMYSLLGGIIHEVPKEAVKATTCPVRVRKIETGYMPDYNAVLMGDGTIDYSKIVEDLTHNKERFRKVLDTVNSLDGSAIVLANRVEYLSRLSESFAGRSVCLSTLGQSKKAKQMRKDALAKLKDGELDCIFATYALAKEGLDVPNLRYVVFATPEKDETTVIQSAGRVGRKAEGKEYGTVIDFVDSFGMYRGWSKKRDRYYKKIDAEIE